MTSLIIGGRTEAQFRDNLACVNVKLTDDERARLDKVSQPPLIYPYWHQSLAAKDRLGHADLALHAPVHEGVRRFVEGAFFDGWKKAADRHRRPRVLFSLGEKVALGVREDARPSGQAMARRMRRRAPSRRLARRAKMTQMGVNLSP